VAIATGRRYSRQVENLPPRGRERGAPGTLETCRHGERERGAPRHVGNVPPQRGEVRSVPLFEMGVCFVVGRLTFDPDHIRMPSSQRS